MRPPQTILSSLFTRASAQAPPGITATILPAGPGCGILELELGYYDIYTVSFMFHLTSTLGSGVRSRRTCRKTRKTYWKGWGCDCGICMCVYTQGMVSCVAHPTERWSSARPTSAVASPPPPPPPLRRSSSHRASYVARRPKHTTCDPARRGTASRCCAAATTRPPCANAHAGRTGELPQDEACRRGVRRRATALGPHRTGPRQAPDVRRHTPASASARSASSATASST